MASVNKAILIGNLGKDPELRRTPNGNSVATFNVATSEKWNDKSGAKQEHTEWHTVVAWGKLAELANQYLKKGRSVYIEGRITTRSWDDKDGTKRYKTEIVANQIQFLGSNTGSGSGNEFASAPPIEDSFHGPEASANFNQSLPAVAAEDDLPF